MGKLGTWSVLGAAVAVTLAVAGCDQSEAPAPAPAPAEVASDQVAASAEAVELPEYQSLHDLMEDMGRSYKFLRRNAHQPDADPAELAKHIATMRAQAEVAKGMTPDEVTEAPAEKQAELAALYQEHLGRIAPALDNLEAAIAEGDAEAIKAAVVAVHDTEEHGHKALGVEDH